MKTYNRISNMPPYMLEELTRLKYELSKCGHCIIDLSIGDPDLPTPGFIINALKKGVEDKRYYRYPPNKGTDEFRNAVADYYRRRFNVTLDPDNEILALIGSKEGIAHLSLALIDTGDNAIIPEPSYPIYKSSVYMAGGHPFLLYLNEGNNYLPDISFMDEGCTKNIKIMYMNYPNNPTGSICDIEYFNKLIRFALKNDIMIVNDSAYNEIVFDRKPVSILEAEGAKNTALEIGTLSKSYNMTGWRIGYMVGNSEAINKVSIIKSNIDSGQFGAVQHAAATALNEGDEYILQIKEVYKRRRDLVLKIFYDSGVSYAVPYGTFYVWFKVPQNISSLEYAYRLVIETGVLVTPGVAFGSSGEGFCRLSLTTDEAQLSAAVEKIAAFKWQ